MRISKQKKSRYSVCLFSYNGAYEYLALLVFEDKANRVFKEAIEKYGSRIFPRITLFQDTEKVVAEWRYRQGLVVTNAERRL